MNAEIVKKDTVVIVKHILGETAENVLTCLGGNKYKFNCDAYVEGETCNGGFFHLRQAREVLKGKQLGFNIRPWQRLRKALKISGVNTVHIPGGSFPIHYEDEIVVPDHYTSGAYYYVIKNKDIGKYLKNLPLDEAGKKRTEKEKEKKAKAKAEAYRQEHDPKCISTRIGEDIWYAGASCLGGEFKKITLVADDGSSFSIIYPELSTNFEFPCNFDKFNPNMSNRLERIYVEGWHEYAKYLMPNPKLADKVMKTYRWLGMFDSKDNDGISPELISSAKRVVLEAYDLNDKILDLRFVYTKATKKVHKEYLRENNWTKQE